jgi:hypothetical protein
MSKCIVLYNKETRRYKVIKDGVDSMPCASIREAKLSWKILKQLHKAVFTIDNNVLVMNVELKGAR